METSKQRLLPPPNRPLQNRTCPYCGVHLTETITNKEHVVGRNFVPTGALSRSWNLILQSCKSCNTSKSNLEDDISAISLLLLGSMTHQAENRRIDTKRKAANSLSRRTGRPVAQSTETTNLQTSLFGGIQLSATIAAPPQIDMDRAYDLAGLQLAAFCYLNTYDPITRQGWRWPGGFFPVDMAARADWGNQVQQWFMKTVAAWQLRVFAILAEGFYKIVVRRHPKEELWSWAIEWNKTIRVIGFIGEEEAFRAIMKDIPKMRFHIMSQQGDRLLAIRMEVPLSDEEDVLFALEEGILP